MDTTSKFKVPESHVAQQSRRDKLRVHHFEDLNPDLVQVRNDRNADLLFDPTLVSSGIIANSSVLPPQMPTYASSNVSGGQQSCGDWNPMFVGEVLSNNAAMKYPKPNYSAYQDVQPALSNPGGEICSRDNKMHCGDFHFVSSSLYPNGLQDIVTTASVGTQIAHQASPWTSRPVLEHCQQWGGELGFFAAGKSNEEPRAGANDTNTNTTQGLSLTLSSDPTWKICSAAQFTEESQDSKAFKPGHLYSMQKPSIISKGSGNSTYSSPLGPFTGYATILKNSRFLKPAQELLDQYCHMTNSKLVGQVCEPSEGIFGDAGDSALVDVTDAVGMEGGATKGNNTGASFSSFHSSSGSCRVDIGVGSSSGESFRPELQQKKAKLLYLQEEVCRRYKLHYQQMQMVVSSFESVAGLSAAAPHVSMALKTVERNFRCLRNAISDRVRHISRALGEDLLSPTTGSNSSKGDINMSRLKHGFQKSGGVNVGFHEPQQQGWRPQRGLPERAVAILRAWLFEHFLHPYPTDADKHMLATQTGLSRNQVSNWFINARVRVWKPMVEEIHMLESKDQNSSKSDATSTSERGTIRSNEDQSINRSCINATSDRQLACADTAVTGIMGDANDSERWYHDKRSRMDFRIPTSIEGPLISFAPYEQSGLEMGGLGAVSLTLGLRHGVETAQGQQHQQQYQQREDQLRRQFGGQMIHDFVG